MAINIPDPVFDNPPNAYARTMQQNELNSRRRAQMMADRLMQDQQPLPRAPTGPSFMPLSTGGGGDAGGSGAGGGILGGLNPQLLAKAMQGIMPARGPDPVAQQFAQTGIEQSGLGAGNRGWFGATRNSEGANVLQNMGLFNPLSQS